MKHRRILVPIDGSSHSKKAVYFAADLCRSLKAAGDAELVLIHVMPPDYTEKDKLRGEVILNTGRHLAESAGSPVSVKLHKGEVWRDIVREAKLEKYYMIVMGSKGKTGVRRILLGSVAEDVFKNAPCPVAIVR